MFHDRYVTHDAAHASLDTSVDGISTDEGQTTINWDEMSVVTIDDPPYASAFDTTQFYRIPVTVARPIKQQYTFDHLDEPVTLMKPRDALKRAAWSLDNKPVTLGHPDDGTVTATDLVHGFWSDQRYIDGRDDLDAAAYVPKTDTDATDYIEDNNDVSVGFHHTITKPTEYDSDVTSLDSTDGVDGFQTDMYFDHCAFVRKGRCSDEDGCGWQTDSNSHTHGTVMQTDEPDTSVPDGAQEAAQQFLDAVERGNVPDSCGGPDGTGRRRAQQLSDGGDISMATWVDGTDGIANWHARHEGNEEYDESEVDTPWEDCGYAMYKAWGGETAKNKAMRLDEQTSTDATSMFSESDMVQWQDGAARGEIIDVKTRGCFNEEIDGDVEVCAGDSVVYLIEEDDGKTVAHKEGTLTAADSTSVTIDAPDGIYETGDQLFAVAPDEHTKDSTDHTDDAMYEVTSCADVADAWQLRNSGEDMTIERNTLHNRIKRVAEAKNCEEALSMINEDSADSTCQDCDDCTDCGNCHSTENAFETTVTTELHTREIDMEDISIDISDLSADAALDKLGESHDGIAELAEDVAEYREAYDAMQNLADTLDTDIESVDEKVSEMQTKANAYDEQRSEELQSKAEELAEMTDSFESADEVLAEYDEDYDAIVDRLELLSEMDTESTEDGETSTTTTDASGDSGPSYEEQIASDRHVPEAWQ